MLLFDATGASPAARVTFRKLRAIGHGAATLTADLTTRSKSSSVTLH